MNNYIELNNISDIERIIEYCNITNIVSFYILTHNKVDYISITFQIGNGYIIEIAKLNKDIINILNNGIFENVNVIKYSWDIKKSMIFMSNIGFKFNGIFNDGLIIQYLLNLNLDDSNINAVFDLLLNKKIGEDIYLYSDYILRICIIIYNNLYKHKSIYNIYRNLYCPFVYTIFNIQKNGMLINKGKLSFYLNDIKKELKLIEDNLNNFKQVKRFETKKINELKENKIKELKDRINKTDSEEVVNILHKELNEYKTGVKYFEYKINYNSNEQLIDLLYGKYGFMYLPVKVNGKEVINCKNEILNLIDDEYGFIKLLIEYKKLNLIYKTYLSSINEKMDIYGYIHSEFKQNGTETGRLSSVNPNLQNIPKNGVWAKRARELFIAPKGYKFMQCDLSQIELRVIAYLSEDERMVMSYAKGEDLHNLTAMNTLGINELEWWALSIKERNEKRDAAKSINFGFLYGMGVDTFRQYARKNFNIEFSEKECINIRNNFFNLYSGLKEFYDKFIYYCRHKGYVETLFGHRRIIKELNAEDRDKLKQAERKCINTVIQGTAGEYNIFATCLLSKLIGDDAIIINSIHDSVLLYVKEDKIKEIADKVIFCYENPPLSKYFKFNFEPVGMKVNIEVGDNWDNLIEYKI